MSDVQFQTFHYISWNGKVTIEQTVHSYLGKVERYELSQAITFEHVSLV